MDSENFYYKADPFNFLITLLIGVASVVFILAYSSSFETSGGDIYALSGIVAFVYFILIFILFRFRKQEIVQQFSERVVEKEVERAPIVKEVYRDVEKPVYREIIKEIEKPVIKEVPFLVKEEKPKKSKYVGSKYNERYHLRKCRFAGAIKKKYLIEEDEKKYFKLRGYEACKVCHPEKN